MGILTTTAGSFPMPAALRRARRRAADDEIEPQELQALEATDPRDIWLAELEEVQSAWKDWNETVVAEEETTTTNNKRKGGGKKEAATKRRKKN